MLSEVVTSVSRGDARPSKRLPTIASGKHFAEPPPGLRGADRPATLAPALSAGA
jgi:hypothetical protein